MTSAAPAAVRTGRGLQLARSQRRGDYSETGRERQRATHGVAVACPLRCAAALYNPPIMATIEIEKLSKSYVVYQKQEGLGASLRGLFRREYREVQAVREIDLTVEQGEFVAFLGPNGAGKTTTLKLLSGVITPVGRRGARDGARPLETRKRLSPPLRPGDGTEEPAVVGPARPGVVSAAPADLSHRSRRRSSRRSTN